MSEEQADKRCNVPEHEHRQQNNRLVAVTDAQYEGDRAYRADDCRHQSDGAESARFTIGIDVHLSGPCSRLQAFLGVSRMFSRIMTVGAPGWCHGAESWRGSG